MPGFPDTTPGPIARASDLCPCGKCSASPEPTPGQVNAVDVAQRFDQARDHEAQARDIALKVNDLLADRKAHLDAAGILRQEAADIVNGKL